MEHQLVDLSFMASITQSVKQNIILSNSTFHNPSIDISFGGFLKNSMHAIFFWMRPAMVWSNLISTLVFIDRNLSYFDSISF